MFSEYGRQKGWERENPATDSGNPSEKTMDGFVEVTEQMEPVSYTHLDVYKRQIQNHVTEILIITDMGGLQHFQMGVVFARAIPTPMDGFIPTGAA